MKKPIHTHIRATALAMAACILLSGCGASAGPGDVPEPDLPGTGPGFQDMGGYGHGRQETPADPGPDQGGPAGAQGDGTGSTEPPPDPVPAGPEPAAGLSDVNPFRFEDGLQAYLDGEKGWRDKSYMVSPASFRAALCLAIEGAAGGTRSGLLDAAGFDDGSAMAAWYGRLLDAQSGFNSARDALDGAMAEWGPDGNTGTGMAFDIANAVWDNSSFPGGFNDDYAGAIRDKYGAWSGSSDAGHITEDVNGWCEESTHGMIESISPDLSNARSVLANALYIKSAWNAGFSESLTERGDFIKPDGSAAELEFMSQTDDFAYHKDPAGREYALFGLEGGLWLEVCLDPDARPQDMMSAMYNAQWRRLDVKMPKLDLETTLGAGELAGYLSANGAADAFGDSADFSAMTDPGTAWHIGDIIQKTRLKTDEDGLEAAAVTAIMMTDAAILDDPDVPIEFYMDRPFSFMITAGRYTADSDALILFIGRYAG